MFKLFIGFCAGTVAGACLYTTVDEVLKEHGLKGLGKIFEKEESKPIDITVKS